jgi:hypothetical protein
MRSVRTANNWTQWSIRAISRSKELYRDVLLNQNIRWMLIKIEISAFWSTKTTTATIIMTARTSFIHLLPCRNKFIWLLQGLYLKEQCKTSLGISSLFLTSENWRLASLFLFIFIRSAHVYSCYHYITTTCYLVIFSMVSNLFNFIYSMTDVDVRSFFPVSYQSAVLRQTLWLVINRPIINRCR